MEDLNRKQGITELVRCSSSSSDEGRLAMGPPDPSTTLGWRERGQGREDSMVVGTGYGLSPSHLGWATATDELMSLRVPSISSTSTAETIATSSYRRALSISATSASSVWATASGRQHTPFASSISATSAIIASSDRRYASSVLSAPTASVTFASNEHLERELARNRATYNGVLSVGPASAATSTIRTHRSATSGSTYLPPDRVVPAYPAAISAAVVTSTVSTVKTVTTRVCRTLRLS